MDNPTRSSGEHETPAALEAARARAANPEAEDAIPAEVGKLFSETTRAEARIPAIRRTASRTLRIRVVSSFVAGLPFNVQRSSEASASKTTVVVVRASRRVMEMDGFKGSARSGRSRRVPQYLMKAMLLPALAVAFIILRVPLFCLSSCREIIKHLKESGQQMGLLC
jgi:hypothetical protein